MKIERIKYEQLFPTGEYANQRLSVEISLEAEYHNDETRSLGINSAFQEAKRLVNDAFQKLNPGSSSPSLSTEPPIVQVERQPVHARTEEVVADIMSCTEIKVLESYRIIARANQQLQEAYDKRLKELQ